MTSEAVTVERIERGLVILAWVVTQPGGEVYAPLFERLEKELQARRRGDGAVARAHRLLDTIKHPDSFPGETAPIGAVLSVLGPRR